MGNKRKPNGYWTYEKCKDEALKYYRRVDFHKNSSGAYTIAYRNEWLNEICQHMVILSKPTNYWFENKDKCQEEALKYTRRVDFNQSSYGAYNAAYLSNWLDEICSHMDEIRKPNNFWNFDKCFDEAKKYSDKKSFLKNSHGAYESARLHGWLDKICEHMIPIGSKYKRLIYSFEFPDKSVYVGLTYNSEKRYYNHIINTKTYSTVRNYMIETNLTPEYRLLTDYVDVGLAIKLEDEYLKKYKNDGWAILNKIKTGGIGGTKRINILNG